MSEPQDYSALSKAADLSKVNPYGVDDERLQELRDAQQEALKALKSRYDEPNWWNIAAGFAKPQLGGFLASVGSASEAMGQTEEQRRSQQLPIAQMNIAMQQSNLLLAANKKAADMVKARKDAGLPITPEFAAEVARIAPESSVAKALQTEIGTQQKTQELAGQRIQIAKSLGRDPNPYDLQLLEQSTAPTSPPKGEAEKPKAEPTAPAAKPAGVLSTDDWLKANQSLEGLKPGEKSKTSSATGPFGLIDSTREALQKKYNLPNGYGTDPEVTKKYGEALIKDNQENILKPNNLDNNALNHRLAHWFGNDAPKLLNADPASKISDTLSPEIIKANGLDPNARVGKLISRVEGNLWDQGINPKFAVGQAAPDAQAAKPAQTAQAKKPLPTDPSDPSANQNLSFNDFGFAPVPQNAFANDATKAQYGDLEKKANARLDRLEFFGAPENSNQYRTNISALMDYAEKSPENRKAIANVVNRLNTDKPLVNALLASGEEGFHGNINGVTASVGIPIKTFLNNFQNKEEQKVAQMLILALDNANYVNGKLKGMSATANIPAAEANLLTAGQLSRDMNYGMIMHNLAQVDNTLDMQKDLYNGSSALLNKYGTQLSPLAAHHQIVNSDWFKNTVNTYNKRSKDLSDSFNTGMSVKKGG